MSQSHANLSRVASSSLWALVIDAYDKTKKNTIAEGLRDAFRQLKSCHLSTAAQVYEKSHSKAF